MTTELDEPLLRGMIRLCCVEKTLAEADSWVAPYSIRPAAARVAFVGLWRTQ